MPDAVVECFRQMFDIVQKYPAGADLMGEAETALCVLRVHTGDDNTFRAGLITLIRSAPNAKEVTRLMRFARTSASPINVDEAVGHWRNCAPQEWLLGPDGVELIKELRTYCWETWRPRTQTN